MAKKIGIFLGRSITVYLILAMLVIASVPTQSAAMFISSDSIGVSTASIVVDAAADAAKVRTFLESKIVSQRLSDFGLTSEEVSSRLNQLSAEQIHQIASQIDQVDTGGDSFVGGIIAVLVIIILIIVVMKLMGLEIVIK